MDVQDVARMNDRVEAISVRPLCQERAECARVVVAIARVADHREPEDSIARRAPRRHGRVGLRGGRQPRNEVIRLLARLLLGRLAAASQHRQQREPGGQRSEMSGG